MFKRLLAIATAASVGLSAAAAGAADSYPGCPDKLKLGIEAAYPPFQFVGENGDYKGFEVDLTEAICKEIGADCTWVQVPWASMIPALKAKKYDVLVGSMAATDRRDQQIDFTNKYYDGAIQFIGPKDMKITVSDEGLEGMTIGVQRATTQAKLVTNRFADVADIRTYDTQKEVNLDLINGRIDLMMADRLVTEWGFLQTKKGQPFEFKGPKFGGEKYYGDGIAYGVRTDDNELTQCLNKAIKAVRKSGKYLEISKKWFGRSIYNG